MTKLFAGIASALLLFVTGLANAQSAAAAGADPKDVESVDAIMAAVYDSISGGKGVARDWDRFKSLFHPQAKLIPSGPNGAAYLSVDDYPEMADPFFQEAGFFEEEIARRTATYGQLVHVWSTYTSKYTLDDPAPFARGINSFQLMFHDDRWWVMNIYWLGETPDNPIPGTYLPE